VVKLDRLGRNTRDVLNLVHELEEKGANLRVLEPAIDAGGPTGRMVLTVLGMVAEMESLASSAIGNALASRPRKLGEFTKAALSLSTAHASCRSARKEWAPLRSRRSSGASEETSTRHSRPRG
jgi:Resolvase, N terminal domain